MLDAASEIHSLNQRKDKNGNDIVDCAVSCDGSWQRRGFSSLDGFVTAISMATGKIVDAEIMSRYCKGCVSNETYKTLDPIRYERWQADHQCKINPLVHYICPGNLSVNVSSHNLKRNVTFKDL